MVNFDHSIWELLAEAKYFTRLGLDIPDTAFRLCLKEEKITKNKVGFKLRKFQKLVQIIPIN